MKLFWKMLILAVSLAVLFLVAFMIWGEPLERIFGQQACVEWFAEVRPYAWALGIGLLIADLLLPIPATGIMAALGSVYGFLFGGGISVVGSAAAGFIGYLVARYAGKGAIRLLASEDEILRFQAFFERWGGVAIIVSRAMPIMPEVMAILAGTARMGMTKFLTALLLGTVPTCLLFSYMGHAARSQPVYAVVIAVLASLAVWPLFAKLISAGGSGRHDNQRRPGLQR